MEKLLFNALIDQDEVIIGEEIITTKMRNGDSRCPIPIDSKVRKVKKATGPELTPKGAIGVAIGNIFNAEAAHGKRVAYIVRWGQDEFSCCAGGILEKI